MGAVREAIKICGVEDTSLSGVVLLDLTATATAGGGFISESTIARTTGDMSGAAVAECVRIEAKRARFAWASLRDFASQLWNFELFTVTQTVEVDGRKTQVPRGVTVGKVVQAPLLLLLGLFAAVKLTDIVLAGQGWGPAWPWWQLLLGFDVVFLVAGLLTFEFVLEA